MVRSRKGKKLDKGTEARRRARQAGIVLSTTRVIPDKRKKPGKHRSREYVEGE
jgi:hypothetical protein